MCLLLTFTVLQDPIMKFLTKLPLLWKLQLFSRQCDTNIWKKIFFFELEFFYGWNISKYISYLITIIIIIICYSHGMNSAKFYLATKETLEKVWNMFKVSSKDNKVTKTMSNHKNSSFVNITTSCLANNCFILFEQTKTTDLKETLIIKFSLFNCLCFLVFF